MDTVIARVLKTDNQGRATVIAVDDKAYIAAWTVNGDISSEREACAKVAEDLASNTPQLLLHAGEMETQELLTSKAVLKLVASLIRARGEK